MISEDVLERGLAAAAEQYEVPADAVDELRELIAPSVATDDDDGGEPPRRRTVPRPHGWQWLPVAAAGLAALIAIPIAVGGAPPESGAPSASAPQGSASADFQNTTGPQDAPHAAAPVPRNASRAELSVPGGSPDALGAATAPSGSAAGGGTTYGKYAPSGTGSVQDSNSQPAPLPDTQQRIVRTGSLDLQVPKDPTGNAVQGAVTKLTQLADSEGGYVDSSEVNSTGDNATATVTMRVPVGKFDDAINRASAFGTKIENLRTSSEDVTGKYVDLSARIRSAERTRSMLQNIMAKATTIGQILTVQSRIDSVQTEIERLTGQRKLLANQSALSTLTVNVNQPTPILQTTTKHDKPSGLSKAFHTSVDRFMNGVEAIIGIIGPVLLVLILVGLAWVIGRLGYRRFRRSLV